MHWTVKKGVIVIIIYFLIIIIIIILNENKWKKKSKVVEKIAFHHWVINEKSFLFLMPFNELTNDKNYVINNLLVIM